MSLILWTLVENHLEIIYKIKSHIIIYGNELQFRVTQELERLGEINCPFCNKQIAEYCPKEVEQCCSNQELETVDGYITCLKCGQVNGI